MKLSNNFLNHFLININFGLETSTRSSDSNFIFDSVYLLHYKCHKINLKREGSYIDSLD